MVKYEELSGSQSISGIQFDLSAYPVLPQPESFLDQRTAFTHVRPSTPPPQRFQKTGPRGMNTGLGDLPKYPPEVNVEASISILAVVAPDGSIKTVQPWLKGNTRLENAAMKELTYWKFESLSSSAPQLDRSCVVTFLCKLK